MTTKDLHVSEEQATPVFAPSVAEPGGWMPPSEALNRFQPLGNALLGKVGTQQEAGDRYGFRIGALGLLVLPRTLTELIPMAPIVAIPNGPPWLQGMINLRSHLVPVFDLPMMCGMPSLEEEGRWILVLDTGERSVGMIVAEYPRRLRDLKPIAQLPSLPDALQRGVSAGYLEQDSLWLELDHRAFFSSFANPSMDSSP